VNTQLETWYQSLYTTFLRGSNCDNARMHDMFVKAEWIGTNYTDALGSVREVYLN
jgi:hypothetical protein